MMEWLAYNELEPIGIEQRDWAAYSEEGRTEKRKREKPQTMEEMQQAFRHITSRDNKGNPK